MSKKKARYGFVGTSGLVLMVGAGSFATLYATYIVYKLMNGLSLEQSTQMLIILGCGGGLPYLTGGMMFKHGKKVKGGR